MILSKYIWAAFNNPASIPWKLFNLLRRRFSFDYWLFSGWSFPPEMVTILITKRCNFHCAGCSSSSPEYTANFKGSELSTQEIKNFIKSVAWFKPGIYFCGGEPTLRADLFELVSYAKKLGMVTAFTTNGSLLNKENIDKILFSGLDFISVSLDGTAKHHNEYRGFPKAYEKLVTGVERLLKRRKELKKNIPRVRITCIVNPENKDDSLFVLKKAEELTIDELAFGNLMFYPETYKNKQKNLIKQTGIGGIHMIGLPVGKKLPFNVDKRLLGLYAEIRKISKIPVIFVPKEMDYLKFFSFKDLSNKSKCLSPWFVATLMPDGNLSSCQEFSLGNIKEKSFMALWNSHGMKKFRQFRRQRVFPACFRCLEGQEIKFE